MISDCIVYVNEFTGEKFILIPGWLIVNIHTYDISSLAVEESYQEQLIRQLTWGFFVFITISGVVLLETLLLNRGCSIR